MMKTRALKKASQGSGSDRFNRSDLRRFKRVLKQHMPDLAERYGIRSLGVFGSYARRQQHQRSDLDVLVEFENDALSLLKFIEVQNYLSDLLAVKVDLVEKSGLKPSVRERVLREVEPV